MNKKKNFTWYKVLESKEDIIENRVITVTAGHTEVCLSKFEGKICALDNHCPH